MVALFDAYAGFGGYKPGVRETPSAEQCSSEMARVSIERALVRTAPADMDADLTLSNDALLKACHGRPNLTPCPVVIPSTGGDVPPEPQQVATLLDGGAGAVCIRPKLLQWTLQEWVCGPLFEVLQSRNVPVFCKEQQVSIRELAELAGRYPKLPIILAETGYRWQRVVLPLMKTFGNIYFCLGGAYSLHRGLEQLVEKVGAERILFGTGLPGCEPMAAVTLLMYAEISDAQRAMIGAGNLDRLVAGIKR